MPSFKEGNCMCAWMNKTIAAALVLLVPLSGLGFAQISPEDRHFINPEYSRRISLDLKDASLTEVLKIFSKQAGKNFIATDDVGNKKLTLFFDNIPVEQALEKILSANELEYEEQPGSDIIIVRPATTARDPLVTRIFHLKHASVPASKLNSTIMPGSSASTTGSSTSTTAAAPAATSGTGGGYSTGIYSAIKAVLSKAGILAEDTRTNSFIITDVQSRFVLIEETIAKLDVPVPQILIQVEMLDISKTTSDLMGAKWGTTPLTFAGAAKATFLPFNQSAYLQKIGTSSPVPAAPLFEGGESSSSSETSSSPYQVGKIDTSGMSVIINFLKTRSDTRSLARPRLLTLNNETAEIKISTSEAIGLTTTNFSSSSATQSAVEAERVQTGVFLTVTPQADLTTGEIVMAVSPKVIEARTGATFEGQTFKDPEERGTQSLLRMKDGETIIIGGLLRTENENTVTKVPFLSDIPLLGSMFRHKDKTGNKRELIIFLTPHIIDESVQDPLIHKKFNSYRSEQVNRALSILEQQRP